MERSPTAALSKAYAQPSKIPRLTRANSTAAPQQQPSTGTAAFLRKVCIAKPAAVFVLLCSLILLYFVADLIPQRRSHQTGHIIQSNSIQPSTAASACCSDALMPHQDSCSTGHASLAGSLVGYLPLWYMWGLVTFSISVSCLKHTHAVLASASITISSMCLSSIARQSSASEISPSAVPTSVQST